MSRVDGGCRICTLGEPLSGAAVPICTECRDTIGPDLLARITSAKLALRRGPEKVGEATDHYSDLWAEARAIVAQASEL